MLKIVALALFLVVVAADIAPLLHADSPTVIPGSYIVVLKDGLEILDRDAHILALQDTIAATADLESDVSFRYNVGPLLGFAAHLSKSLLQAQLAHPNVKYIEADQVMSINYALEPRSVDALITQTGATWGISRIDQRSLPVGTEYVYNSIAGAGVDVYVIDTGILTTHVDFGGRATAVYNAITGEANSDLNGHGTHCSGTIAGTTYGVAKAASLKAVKVLDKNGSGTTTGVIAGVNYVTNNKSTSRPSVASMSLGGAASTTLDTAVTNSIAAGVPYSIAAGNDNKDACSYSPARVATAVTVGATTNTDARSSFSNFGSCVNIFAPGTSITSDFINSGNTGTSVLSGTSMAAPHVAGVLALRLSTTTGLTPATLKTWLTGQATSGVITSPGTNSPNLLLYSLTA
jgi:subtilisin family serine protease